MTALFPPFSCYLAFWPLYCSLASRPTNQAQVQPLGRPPCQRGEGWQDKRVSKVGALPSLPREGPPGPTHPTSGSSPESKQLLLSELPPPSGLPRSPLSLTSPCSSVLRHLIADSVLFPGPLAWPRSWVLPHMVASSQLPPEIKWAGQLILQPRSGSCARVTGRQPQRETRSALAWAPSEQVGTTDSPKSNQTQSHFVN